MRTDEALTSVQDFIRETMNEADKRKMKVSLLVEFMGNDDDDLEREESFKINFTADPMQGQPPVGTTETKT
jgi:hypothetical protein